MLFRTPAGAPSLQGTLAFGARHTGQMTVELTAQELARYSRQVLLPEVGVAGQRRLRDARVLVIGAGGLGSPVLLYLTAAGVGTIGLIDDDLIEESNLQRQIVHHERRVGTKKVASAAAAARRLNSGVRIVELDQRLTGANVGDLIADYDLVVDGSDNFDTRYTVNDACVAAGKTVVWGSILGFHGQVSVFGGGGPSLRDVFPVPPAPGTVPSCSQAGVLGALCGVIGSTMATEALKLIIGIGDPLRGRLLVHDALAMTFDVIGVRARATDGVPLGEPGVPLAAAAGPTAGVPTDAVPTVTADELSTWLSHDPGLLVVDVREAAEVTDGMIDRSVHLPLAEVLAGGRRVTDLLGPAREVVLVCQSGVRSELAARSLQAQGFRQVHSLADGYVGWATRGPGAPASQRRAGSVGRCDESAS